VDIGVAFGLGFLGSIHCIGMCGGFALLAGAGGARAWRRTSGVAAYLLGKTLTYAILGALLAGFMSALPPSVSIIQKLVAAATGIFMILAGLHFAGYGPAVLLSAPQSSSRFVARMGAAVKRSSVGGRFSLGLLNGLIPCGLLYGALGYSVTMPSALAGAAFMGAFGLGTAPALAFVSLGATALSASRRRAIHGVLGMLVVAMGIMMIFRAAGGMRLLMGGM
jgi:hypothetical protein